MTRAVPPKIHTKKTLIGVGTREVVILGVSAVVALAVVFMPISLVVKVGLAAFIMGTGALLALGRSPGTGRTFEKHFLDIWRFYREPRYYQKGAGYVREEGEAREFTRDEAIEIEKALKKQKARERITIKPLPLSFGGFFSVLSLSFLIMLILWIWTGGLQEFLIRLGILV
jgi:hypothetical protein